MQTTHKKWSTLMIKFFKGTITKSERAELNQQRAASTMKDQQFRRLTNLQWIISNLSDRIKFDKEAGWNEILAKAALEKPTASLPTTQPFRSYRYLGVAACAAGLIMAAAIYYFHKDSNKAADTAPMHNMAKLYIGDRSFLLSKLKNGALISYNKAVFIKSFDTLFVKGNTDSPATNQPQNKLELPKGSTYKLVLPDGSLVSMNASSTIEFPSHFTPNRRTVKLEGEGFFQVAENKKAPFIVLVGKYEIEALGTSFTVHGYPREREISVTLATGKVKVVENNKQKTILNPGQQFRQVDTTHTVVTLNNPLDNVQAWENGNFNFHQDIHAILDDIGKWYGAEVVYRTPLDSLLLEGEYKKDKTISPVLEYLQKIVAKGIAFRYTKEGTIEITRL